MVNILPRHVFQKLKLNDNILYKSQNKLTSYTGDVLKVIDMCKLTCQKNNKFFELEFFVVDSNTQTIVGLPARMQLNLVKRVESIASESMDFTNVINDYKDVFTTPIGGTIGQHVDMLL